MPFRIGTCFGSIAFVAFVCSAVAQEKKETISLADGKITFAQPKEWTKKNPKSQIIEYEMEAPSSEGDKETGRITFMGAGGDVEANITRWIGQFEQPDGSSTKEKTKTQKLSVSNQEVHYVDISGTYKDTPGGPFAGGKTVMREKYRMLGAIIVTKNAGRYFVKFYGPEKTVKDNEKVFQDLVNSLEVK